MASSAQRIRSISPEQRQRFIIDVFVDSFHKLISLDPDAWRGKFRKMAATPFAFYRGSAVLFYADIADDDDSFLDEKTSRVWIRLYEAIAESRAQLGHQGCGH